MALASQTQTSAQKELLDSLNKFELGFLFRYLKDIKGINSLINGVYGQSLLADISVLHKGQAKKDYTLALATTPRLAYEAFSTFAKIKKEFDEKYAQLERNDPSIAASAEKKTVAVAEAFLYAMEKNSIAYPKSGCATNLALSLAENKSDCDTSAILFIQFGREKGLDLIGAKTPNHYFAALRENGRVTLHIETTCILAGGGIPADLKMKLRELGQKCAKLESCRKNIALLEDKSLARSLNKTIDALLKEAREHSYNVKKFGFGIFSAVEWKEAFPDSSYSYDEGINARISLFHNVADLDHMLSVRNYLKNMNPLQYLDRGAYKRACTEIRKAWEANPTNFNLFYSYFALLEISSSGPPILAVDNERELFRLYRKGLELFGKKVLEEKGISISKLKIALNPVDYYKASKE